MKQSLFLGSAFLFFALFVFVSCENNVNSLSEESSSVQLRSFPACSKPNTYKTIASYSDYMVWAANPVTSARFTGNINFSYGSIVPYSGCNVEIATGANITNIVNIQITAGNFVNKGTLSVMANIMITTANNSTLNNGSSMTAGGAIMITAGNMMTHNGSLNAAGSIHLTSNTLNFGSTGYLHAAGDIAIDMMGSAVSVFDGTIENSNSLEINAINLNLTSDGEIKGNGTTEIVVTGTMNDSSDIKNNGNVCIATGSYKLQNSYEFTANASCIIGGNIISGSSPLSGCTRGFAPCGGGSPQCSAGQTQDQACGNGGTQTRNCENGLWGGWSECSNPAPDYSGVNTGTLPTACRKIEGGQLGQNGISMEVEGGTVSFSNWISKIGENGEYVGFSYTMNAKLFISIKAGQDIFSFTNQANGSWVNPNGTSGSASKAISNIVACILGKEVYCLDNTVKPAHSSDVKVLEMIYYSENGVWTVPSVCEWACNEGYENVNGQCVGSSNVCDGITCSGHGTCVDQNGAPACQCDSNYTNDGVILQCINSKQVNCADNAPANATSNIVPVTVTYTTAGGWTSPSNCEWNCNNNYILENGSCINTKQVNCADNAPANATSNIVQVTVTYTTSGGWTTPSTCAWNCNTNYISENGLTCIHSKQVNCIENTPENATSAITLVTITYSSTGGWSTPASCSWSCISGYHNESGTCVVNECEPENSQTENCGLNNRGSKTRTCQNYYWSAWSSCNDPDVCVDGMKMACSNTCFSGNQTCAAGQWDICDAESVSSNYNQPCQIGIGACLRSGVIQCNSECSAIAGTPQDETCDNIDNDCDGTKDEDLSIIAQCGLNNRGTVQRVCSAGVWSDWGECTDPDECTDNSKENEICMVNGKHERTCVTGHWADWTKCICNETFHVNETGDICESDTKTVPCIVNIPENAVVTETEVDIHWTGSEWPKIPECGWVCNNGFDKIGPICIVSLPDPCLNYSCGDHGYCDPSDVAWTQIGTIEDDRAEGIVSYGSYSLFVGSTEGMFNPDVPEGLHGFTGLAFNSGGYSIDQNSLIGDVVYTDIYKAGDGLNYVSATQYFGIIATTGVFAVDETGTTIQEIPLDFDEQIDEVAVLPDGNICFAGQTVKELFNKNMSENFIDNSLGYENIYLGCADSSGNVIWGTRFGTAKTDIVNNILSDDEGNIHVIGSTIGSMFDTNKGEHDVFYAVFSENGKLISGNQFGSARYDMAGDIVLSGDRAFISASTMGSWGGKNKGEMDVAVLSFNRISGEIEWIKQFGSSDNDYSSSILIAYNEYLQVIGYTQGILEPGISTDYDVKGKKTFDMFTANFLQDGTYINTNQFGDAGYHFRSRDADSFSGISAIIAEKGPVIEDVTLDVKYRDLAYFLVETFGRPFFAQCVCDEGYIFRDGQCIERTGCDLIDCSGHGTCIESDGVFFCDCNYGYVWPDDDMTQCTNTRMEQCVDPEKSNSTPIISIHAVTYLPKTDSWSAPPACSFECNDGYTPYEGECVPYYYGDCKVVPVENATPIIKTVPRVYDPITGEYNHPVCKYNCNEGYWPVINGCGERISGCKTSMTRYGSTVIHTNHTIPYNWDAHEWEDIPECGWECLEDFTYDEELGYCVHDRKEDCRAFNVPEHAHANIEEVKVYYSSAQNSWLEPAICTWNCDEGFVLSEFGNGCVPTEQCYYEETARFAEPIITRPSDFLIVLENSCSMKGYAPYYIPNFHKLGEIIAEKNSNYRVVFLSMKREYKLPDYENSSIPAELAEGFESSTWIDSLGVCADDPLTPKYCTDSSRVLQPDFDYGYGWDSIGIGIGKWSIFDQILENYDLYQYFLRPEAYTQVITVNSNSAQTKSWPDFRKEFEEALNKEFVLYQVAPFENFASKDEGIQKGFGFGVLETGGAQIDIGNPWAGKFNFLPDKTLKKTKRDIALTSIPLKDTIKIFYHSQGGSRKIPYTGNWSYNENANSIRIHSREGIETYDDFTIQYMIADGTDVFCGEGLGECGKGRSKTCMAGTWTGCSEVEAYNQNNYQPADDVCDGLDNDCNGIVDDTCICEPGQYYECGMDDAPWSLKGTAYCEDGYSLGTCNCPSGTSWYANACIYKKEINCFMAIPMNSTPLFGDGTATIEYNAVTDKWETTCDYECNEGFVKRNGLCYTPRGFTDQNLENCIAEQLNNEWDNISSIGMLDCSGRNIIRLEGIEQLTSLKKLFLSDNYIGYSFDTEGYSQVISSGVLLDYNDFANKVFEPLSYLQQLTVLDIENNNSNCSQLSISPILLLSKLEELNLSDMSIKYPSLLLQMTELRKLQYRGGINKLENINGINEFAKLEYLDLSSNVIINVDMLRYNTQIRYLNIDYNKITDGGQIHYLPYLEELYITKNPLVETCGDELDNNWNLMVDDGCCEPGDRMVCETLCGEGYRECTDDRNWDLCTARIPSQEICDGIDNDCDGETDEGLLSRTCSNVCGTGVEYCSNGEWQDCNAPWPQMETCDGIDNNCNGTVDEGCDCMTGDISECGISTGECSLGSKLCIGGHWSECSGAVNPVPEICDGLDNNCDGSLDEGCPCDENVPVPCGADAGACIKGTMGCVNGVLTTCIGAFQPEPEVCDGIDNDCDGEVDEALVKSCDTPCGLGKKMCQNGVWSSCVAPNVQSETCDNRDNDCDGSVDNGLFEKRVCGINLTGSEKRICSTGVWGDWQECVDPDSCVNFAEEEKTCGVTGTYARLCLAGQWSSWSNCECTSGNHYEAGICRPNTRFVDCRSPQYPEHAHSEVAVVENLWVSGSWAPAPYCSWSCNEGYTLTDGQCIGGCETYACGENGHCEEHGVAYRDVMLSNSGDLYLDVINHVPGQGFRMYGKASGEFPGYNYNSGYFKIRISDSLEVQEVDNIPDSEWITDEVTTADRIYTSRWTQTGAMLSWEGRYNHSDTGEIPLSQSGDSTEIGIDEISGEVYTVSNAVDGSYNIIINAYSLSGEHLRVNVIPENTKSKIVKAVFKNGKFYILTQKNETDENDSFKVFDIETGTLTSVTVAPEIQDFYFKGYGFDIDAGGGIYIAGQLYSDAVAGPFTGYPMVQAMAVHLTPDLNVDWSYNLDGEDFISAYSDIKLENGMLYLLGGYMGDPAEGINNITEQSFAGNTWVLLTTLSMEQGSSPESWLYGDDRYGSILKDGLNLHLMVDTGIVYAAGVVNYQTSEALMLLKISSFDSPQCRCDEGYASFDDLCLNSRVVSCDGYVPENSTPLQQNVEISITPDGSWEAPVCDWVCNEGYHEYQGSCINGKSSMCDDSSTPENAVAVENYAWIEYYGNDNWAIVPSCEWSCNSGFIKSGNGCLEVLENCDGAVCGVNSSCSVKQFASNEQTVSNWIGSYMNEPKMAFSSDGSEILTAFNLYNLANFDSMPGSAWQYVYFAKFNAQDLTLTGMTRDDINMHPCVSAGTCMQSTSLIQTSISPDGLLSGYRYFESYQNTSDQKFGWRDNAVTLVNDGYSAPVRTVLSDRMDFTVTWSPSYGYFGLISGAEMITGSTQNEYSYSTAWYSLSSGVWNAVSSNLPQIDSYSSAVLYDEAGDKLLWTGSIWSGYTTSVLNVYDKNTAANTQHQFFSLRENEWINYSKMVKGGDGTIYIAGTTTDNPDDNEPYGNSICIIHALDSSYAIKWTKYLYIPGGQNCSVGLIKPSSGGVYIVTKQSNSNYNTKNVLTEFSSTGEKTLNIELQYQGDVKDILVSQNTFKILGTYGSSVDAVTGNITERSACYCNSGFVFENGGCIGSKTVPCDSSQYWNKPQNSSFVITYHELVPDSDGIWSKIPQCQWTCNAGYVFDVNTGQCTYVPEECNGADDNGDGLADENLFRECTALCSTGVETCSNGVWSGCTTRQPSQELCDGVDNDCDGVKDENLTKNCSNECGAGTIQCSGGVWTACNAPAVPSNYGNSCVAGIGMCAKAGTIGCNGLCNAVAGEPAYVEVCNGVDDDCNGTIDDNCENDNTWPEAILHHEPQITVEGALDIIITATDDHMEFWELSMATVGTDDYKVVARGKENVVESAVYTIDPSNMVNGIYEIMLTVQDLKGHINNRGPITLTVDSKLKIGQYSFALNDMTIPVSGIPITVTRTYNSFDKRSGDFGIGWDMLLGSGVKITSTLPLGEGWYMYEDKFCRYMGFGYYIPCYKLDHETLPPKVFVTWPDGKQDRFEMKVEFVDNLSPSTGVKYSFIPLGDTTSTLKADAEYPALFGGGMMLNSDGTVFDTEKFILTTKEGIKYEISRSEGVKTITDTNNNRLVLESSSIKHYQKDAGGYYRFTGREIGFVRDDHGRVVKVTDNSDTSDVRETHYRYNSDGDLEAFTDVSGGEWYYSYDGDHNLISIIDPRGIEIMQMSYDSNGLFIGTADGYGNVTAVEHDIENAREIITDPQGNRKIYGYDDKGYIGSEYFQAYDDMEEKLVKSWTYDSRGNEITETAYDKALSYTTYRQFDEKDNKTYELLPGAAFPKTWEYDARSNLVKEQSATGLIT
ncbi:MAG TPA: MopE-related protein, partial [bacterium]|nr:MopE-related protein [bacterium]